MLKTLTRPTDTHCYQREGQPSM